MTVLSLSRETSPQPQEIQSEYLTQSQDQMNQNINQNPFPVLTAPSPSYSTNYPRTSSSHPNSPFNKPISPPALVMPGNNAPSPSALPPINTNTTSSPAPQHQTLPASQGHALANQFTGMGGLLPPTNPALDHLSGMMGISPIAPNADGPQIFVQPSTPISGLKDGRGHFDAALRRAAALASNNQTQQQQNHTSPQMQPQQSQYHPNVNSVQQSMQQQQFPQNNALHQWNNFDSNLASPLGTRPRAKSDSYTSPGVSDIDRQAFAQFMVYMQNNGGLPTGENAVGEDPQNLKNNVGNWLNSMQTGGQGILDPNQLPGNGVLEEMSRQHQLAQIQAQKNKASPSNNNNQNSPGPTPLSVNTTNLPGQISDSGVLKYEPGQFSPTSMAFYQQRGLFQANQPDQNVSFQPNPQQFPNHFPPITTYNQFTNFNPMQGGQQQQLHQQQNFLNPQELPGSSTHRRKSFTEGINHPAAGAGTPGYGMEFMRGQNFMGEGNTFGTLDPSKVRGVGGMGHRRTAKSEDFGRGGWGLGQGGSTSVSSLYP